jgi:hypothetical protein
MDRFEAERIAKILADAVEAMNAAWVSTQSFGDAVSKGAVLPENTLQLLAVCVSNHEVALSLMGQFAMMLETSVPSILNTANIANQVQEAQKQALLVSQMAQSADAPGRIKQIIDETQKLSNLDSIAVTVLKNTSAAFSTLMAKHPAFSQNSSDKSKTAHIWDRVGNGIAGGVILVLCVGLFAWLSKNIENRGLLEELAHIESARGLLTLLVVGTTIFVGMIIVLGMWLGDGDNESEQKFLRSKEVFSILMTASGTILGFYYGSDKGVPLQPKLLLTAPTTVRSASNSASAFAIISGGKEPYRYSIRSANTNAMGVTNVSAEGGTIVYSWTNLTSTSNIPYTVLVTDSATNQIEKDGEIPSLGGH